MADTTLTKAQPAAYTPRTNLDAAIASQPDEAWVAAVGPREHGFLIKIDDEYEFVTHHGDQFARPWQVERGALGSTPAAHDNGATVSVEPALGGGGSLADVLAEGNDTGGIGIVHEPATGTSAVATIAVEGTVLDVDNRGNADASASATANGVDGIASTAHVDRTATATGTSDAFANTNATAADGDAEANTTVTATGIQDANARVSATTAGGNSTVDRSAIVSDADGGDANANTYATHYADGEAHADTTVSSVGWKASANILASSGGGGFSKADTEADAGDGGAASVLHRAHADTSGTATASLQADAAHGAITIVLTANATAETLVITGLPTADPLLAGQVYSDGVPSAGVPKALMISGGPA